jgi:ABC-type Na+ efflux pump permease subunit
MYYLCENIFTMIVDRRAWIWLLILILALIGYVSFKFIRMGGSGDSGPKQAAIVIKQHSAAFNNSIAATMSAYFEMKSAFVEDDSVKAKEACRKMIALTDSIKLEELKNDTAGIYLTDSLSIENIKANAKSLLQQTDITEMRKDFNMVNENLYPFLKAINYKGPTVYWQNCPMAFGEGKEANWISNTEEIMNPYLGKHHPEFKGSMLHCGEVKDSIISQ